MKKLRIFLLLAWIASTSLCAQTGGPGQPEFMQFQQAGTSDLVNPASGTFSYQIPLFSIGGYPMNLTYQSGILMEDVATMVGLGWNHNPGCINRTMRFLPDDFCGYLGDTVKKQYSVAPNVTYGGKIGTDLEFTGKQKKFTGKKLKGFERGLGLTISAEWGLFYNTYKGWGMERSISGNPSYSFSKSNEKCGATASFGLGSSVNSQNGAERYMSPNLGIKYKGKSQSLNLALGHTLSVNSVEGQKMSLNTSLSLVRGNGVMTKGPQDKGLGTKTSEGSASKALLGYSHNSYLNNSFQSNIDYPFVNESGTFSGTLGWDYYYLDPSLRISGYYSSQKLLVNHYNFPAFGTMYESNTLPDSAMMDYNIEKQMPYLFGESDILAIPFRTPDVFNLSAQGLAMSFSAFRNDIGVVGCPSGQTYSTGTNLGVEMGFGNAFKAGANIGTNGSRQYSSKLSPNPFLAQAGQKVGGKELYKQWYFKNLGEVNKFNSSTWDLMGGHDVVQFDIVDEKTAGSQFSNGMAFKDEVINEAQAMMQSNIAYLTAGEADTTAFLKLLRYHEFGDPTKEIPDQEFHARRFGDEKMPYRKAHHLSMMKVTQPDGMRYEFGLASYNIVQKEVSFNASGLSPNCATNLVTYESEGDHADNSTANDRGIDNFFESTSTPAYATQFLITAVLSSDYSDLTGDGISEDDPGNYVKFAYYKEHQDYCWRTPFGRESATFDAGLLANAEDDRGTYVYGVKELWYIREIESKTEVAEYHYSRRVDGFGVVDENGGKDDKKFLRQLDSIVVYSLPDRRANGNKAVPIKTIHFGYNNTLCTGIDNGESAQTGKSTLESVSFSYGRSQKGKLSPYSFEYGKTSSGVEVNPQYHVRDVNRWGNYQPNPEGAYSDCDTAKSLSNIDYPYASQDKEKMDAYAYAWNLTGITMPSSGKLSVEYESHDYAYVQDKPAGQMFAVSGVCSTESSSPESVELYRYLGDSRKDRKEMAESKPHNRIYFKLNEPMEGTPAEMRAQLQQTYLHDLPNKYLYYKFYVQLSPKHGSPHEFISGYAKVNDYGVTTDGLYGYVDTAAEDLDDDKEKKGLCSPMLRNALQFMRINCNNLIYDNFMAGEKVNSFKDFVSAIKSARKQMSNQAKSFRQGVNMYGKTQRFCHVITPAKSFIRLYSADQFKLAGGSRVKKVSISDNWKIMAGDRYEDKSYSTVYAYTTELKDPGTTKKIISSGVADYEPLVGGDEISLKQPIFYADEKKKAPDTEYYVEDPVNESLFPAPQITYSKVTETSNPENPVIVPNKPPKFVGKTGKIVHEFFTALDYPVEVSYTTIDNERDKSGGGKLEMLSNPLTKTLHDFAMASQGFSIELNNMSGMPKATWVYNENGSLVSGEESEYFKSNHGLTTIDSNGTIHRNSTLGLSVLHTLEGRHSYDQTYSSTANPNFNVSVPFFPVPIVVPLFSTVNEEKQFRSLVTNKTILRNGILKSQTVHSQSASITTENVAFDEITGEVLLTKTTNEFNDSLFSFKYPAWWKYAGMRPSYQNSKMLVNFANQEKTKKFLHAGDELRAINAVSRIWVKDPVIPSFITDDDHATSIGNNIQYIVYNSASKNLLSSPMGQIVTWKWNPILHGDKVDFGTENTLNSSVVEYDDAAVQYCETCGILANRLDKNDYLSGMEGNYKPWMTSFYLAERTSTTLSNGETNIRKEGLFLTYNDFWLPPPTIDAAWEINRKNWEWKEQVNLTDVDGQTIETQDRIERRSASLLGYRDNLVVAQAVNAGYGETYFDGFEDYYYSFCPPPLPNDAKQYVDVNMKRVQKSGGKFQIVENESHTGKYAISVASTLSFTIDPPKLCGGSNSNMGTTNGGTTWNSSTSPTAGGGGATHVTMPNPCISCVGGFNPIANKEYIFSAWVKVNSTAPVVTCADAFVMISAAGRQPVTLRSKGPVIEGWQLIQGKFSTPALTNEVTVTLNKGLELTYYDDLRIFPADGNMASYVYDDVNLKLTYTLDENNYFTKYEYNNQGELIRIKQETEDGIVTEKEGNNGIVKQ